MNQRQEQAKNFPTALELIEKGYAKGRDIAYKVINEHPIFPEGAGLPENLLGKTDKERFSGHCKDELHYTDTIQKLISFYAHLLTTHILVSRRDSPYCKDPITEPYYAGFLTATNEVWDLENERIKNDEEKISDILSR